ncbi:WbuC family cupin fold metalloprotein [Limnohabitans sp. DM1]|uniref:WbuC family cupin fold metalloprotein n=1 Tax=Limnohabitans sp. DM1 TaxID=1597955 RepID=UPI000AAEBA39|nr:WbuC family cupin fold metalloprotein [Limnohabitans sp. DM1]
MKIFSAAQLNALVTQAEVSARLRQHQNIHKAFDEPCQRLFNAIEPGSYIRPHRHASVPRDELLVAIRGLMALVTFDDEGKVQQVVRFGSEKYGPDLAVGVELAPQTWHTVVALVPGSVLLEVKAGPFDPAQPKNLADWAPDEGSERVTEYMNELQKSVEE